MIDVASALHARLCHEAEWLEEGHHTNQACGDEMLQLDIDSNLPFINSNQADSMRPKITEQADAHEVAPTACISSSQQLYDIVSSQSRSIRGCFPENGGKMVRRWSDRAKPKQSRKTIAWDRGKMTVEAEMVNS